jgi:hypothetical protein
MEEDARVDIGAVLSIARQYDSAADLIDSVVQKHLSGLMFDGACAGRAHAARGDGVRRAVEDVVDRLRQWSRAATEIATALRASADRYVDADAGAAARLG